MNKKVTTILLILISLIIYFIQKNIFSKITIAGVMPNLFIIYILFLGLYTNSKVSISVGIFIGIIIDSVYGKCIGISAIMFCIVAYLASYFDKNFSKDNKITIILMGIGATFIYELGYYLINSFVMNYSFEIWGFIKIMFVENLYNTLLLILIYPLFKRLGNNLDRKYKKSNLLTRYF